MKELQHTNCGGELDILFVDKSPSYKIVEFKCRKCKEEFSYEEGLDF